MSMVSGAEALKRFEQVIPRLSVEEIDGQFVSAATRVLSDMSESDRMDIGRRVFDVARRGDVDDPELTLTTWSPDAVARVMGKIARQDRRALVRIFERQTGQPGSISEWVEMPLAKRLYAGIAADVARTVLLGET
jgi:hypothetical protein